MALVNDHFEVVIQFADTGDDRVTRTVRLNEPAYADAATDAGIVVNAYAAMSDCVIAGYSLNQKFIENALTLPANAQNENQALFSGKVIGDPSDSAIASVPGIKNSLMVAPSGKSNNIVDMGDAAVLTWINLFDLDGVATLSDGENWDTTTVSGKRRHTKNNNG